MRAIYAYHTKSLHWSDIGYNFLIDRYGVIYEGHYGGVSRGVIGAQVLGFNTGSTGISVIGTFTNATPPSGAVTVARAAARVEAGRPPRRPPGDGHAGVRVRREVRDGAAREVPGHRRAPRRQLHRLPRRPRCTPSCPTSARSSPAPGSPRSTASSPGDPAISPNGDGVNDKVTIGFTVSQQATWTVEIRDAAGQARPTAWAERARSSSRRGAAGTTTATPCPTACTRCRPTRPAPPARLVPRRPTCGSTRSRPRSRAPAPIPTRSAPTATGRTTSRRSRTPRRRPCRRASRWSTRPATCCAASPAGRASPPAAQKVHVGRPRRRGRRCGAGARGHGHAAPGGARCWPATPTAVRRKVAVDRTLKLGGASRKTFSPNGDGVHDDVTLSFKLTRAGRRRGHRGSRRFHRPDASSWGVSAPARGR